VLAASDPMADSQPPSPNRHTSDHLANERTFLAWIRTSIAVIGLGFVVARFSLWLRELAARVEEGKAVHRPGLSLPLGVGMMALGAVIAIMAAWRYRRVRGAIERGEPAAAGRTIVLLTLMVVAMSAALVVYMVATR
jgi:putative membrane protein